MRAIKHSPDASTDGADPQLEGYPAWAVRLMAPVVAATYWFDPGERGKPYSIRIRFTGRRVEIEGRSTPQDRFDVAETVDRVVPGSGPVAVTTRVEGVNPGRWLVTAEPVLERGRLRHGQRERPRIRRADDSAAPETKPSLLGSIQAWGTPKMSPRLPGPVSSSLRPYAPVPGSLIGVWPALVGLGVLIGLLLQQVLVRRSHLHSAGVLAISVAALVGGAVGAKLWYLAARREVTAASLSEGLCIQGFITGVAIVLLAGLVLLHLPLGTFADDSAPGLLLGMAIGRPGCFVTGCCAGRPTASRWGLWASDRRVGARRLPVQLWEALLALLVASVSLTLVLHDAIRVPGAIALGGIVTYTLGRQLLFPFRSEPRRSALGRPTVLAVAALILAADAVCWLVTCI